MKLLSPIKIGSHEVKNRLVSTAHSAFVDFWKPGDSGERYMAYQERRARGGTGLIIMTAMHVHASSQKEAHFIYEPQDIAKKYQQMSTRVHSHGAKLVQQLFHYGAVGKSNARDDLQPLWSLSGMTSDEGEASHAMTDAEIEEVIESFARTAAIVVENGVDGVELHGTHGYLLQASFSPWGNTRTDKWGEPLYFLKTLAKRVRGAIGSEKIMGFRISADDFLGDAGGLGPEKLCEVAAEAVGTGLFDYLNHSEGAGGAHYARAIGSYRHKLGEFLPLTKGLRDAVNGAIPVIGVGKIPTPDLAEQALQAGDCDLVGMTRAQISDPDLVVKLQSGQGNRIRLCTGANQGCIDRTGLYPITCIHNPEVGEEGRFKELDKAIEKPKRVLVVGGGPAGMKAAEIAARRGHEVTLAEAGSRLGGRLNLVETMGDAANLLSSVSWIEQELSILKVNILLQTAVDEAFVRSSKPDAIIMATGSTSVDTIPASSDGSIPVISSDDAAMGVFNGQKFDMANTRVLVIDIRANYETALVIDSLAKRGCKVTVVTPYYFYGYNVGFTHLTDYYRSFPNMGVELLPLTVLQRIDNGKVYLVHALAKKELPAQYFDLVVAGVNPRPKDELFDTFSKLAPTKTVGDVVAPRSALEAFREGDRAGRTV